MENDGSQDRSGTVSRDEIVASREDGKGKRKEKTRNGDEERHANHDNELLEGLERGNKIISSRGEGNEGGKTLATDNALGSEGAPVTSKHPERFSARLGSLQPTQQEASAAVRLPWLGGEHQDLEIGTSSSISSAPLSPITSAPLTTSPLNAIVGPSRKKDPMQGDLEMLNNKHPNPISGLDNSPISTERRPISPEPPSFAESYLDPKVRFVTIVRRQPFRGDEGGGLKRPGRKKWRRRPNQQQHEDHDDGGKFATRNSAIELGTSDQVVGAAIASTHPGRGRLMGAVDVGEGVIGEGGIRERLTTAANQLSLPDVIPENTAEPETELGDGSLVSNLSRSQCEGISANATPIVGIERDLELGQPPPNQTNPGQIGASFRRRIAHRNNDSSMKEIELKDQNRSTICPLGPPSSNPPPNAIVPLDRGNGYEIHTEYSVDYEYGYGFENELDRDDTNLDSELFSDDWAFAGWGSLRYLDRDDLGLVEGSGVEASGSEVHDGGEGTSDTKTKNKGKSVDVSEQKIEASPNHGVEEEEHQGEKLSSPSKQRGQSLFSRFSRSFHRFASLIPGSLGSGTDLQSTANMSPKDLKEVKVIQKSDPRWGQFIGTSVAGNELLGSVFYSFPGVVARAGVYSPISLTLATLMLFLFRPIMVELAGAIRTNGGGYAYLINTSSKSIALIGAAFMLLDFSATSVVSAATATSYISSALPGPETLPFPQWILTALIILLFTIASLLGMREGVRGATGVMGMHMVAMAVLIILGFVHWIKHGSSQLAANWHDAQSQRPPGAGAGAHILRQIWDGLCLGLLGLTGFECTPSYILSLRPGVYPLVLRNLHIPTMITNGPLMLLVFVALPASTILGAQTARQSNGNMLSLMGERVAGKWFGIVITIDAVVTLCMGVLTGLISGIAVLEKLSQDRVLPGIFLRIAPKTGIPYMSLIFFVSLSGLMYLATGADVDIVSQVFAVAFLSVMFLFPLSCLLLHINRDRLPRTGGPRVSLTLLFSTTALMIAIFVGNIVLDPKLLAYFSVPAVALSVIFILTQNKVYILKGCFWLYCQMPRFKRQRAAFASSHTGTLSSNISRGQTSPFSSTSSEGGTSLDKQPKFRFGKMLLKTIRALRRKKIALLVKTDEINRLFELLLYIRANEETNMVWLVHFYGRDVTTRGSQGTLEGKERQEEWDPLDNIPTELEANYRILDESFPDVTVSLVLVNASFSPLAVEATSRKLGIPPTLMFMGCPGASFGGHWSWDEFGGCRIISG